MMMSRRPVSSPGQVEKYPPPLFRFLRSQSSGGGRSRSKGRSVSSPLFVRRSKSSSAATAAAAAQEPSSPKVTCMGQVRVRRSKQQPRATTSTGSTRHPNRRLEWIRNAPFCHPFAGKLKTRSFSGSCPKWASFSFFNFRRKSNGKENNSRNHPDSRVDPDSVQQNEREIEDEDEGENIRNPRNADTSVSPASTPPRNALMLIRSRSAPPYRSSSLAFRFWEADNSLEINTEELGEGKSRSEAESVSRNSGQVPEHGSGNDRKIEGLRDSESSIKENKVNSIKKEEETLALGLGLGYKRRPVLTRCKSEPARIGEMMVEGWLLDEEEGLRLDRSRVIN